MRRCRGVFCAMILVIALVGCSHSRGGPTAASVVPSVEVAASVGRSVAPSAALRPAPASPSALPPPLTERFESTFNEISMNYPAGWQTRPATERWTDGVISFDAPGFDIIFDPTRGEDLYFALASEPSGGQPDEVWRRRVTLPECPGGHGGGGHTFDGASGMVVTCGGTPVGNHSALLVSDTHGYVIVLYLGQTGLVHTYTDHWFLSVLETMDLRPEDAPETSSPSASP